MWQLTPPPNLSSEPVHRCWNMIEKSAVKKKKKERKMSSHRHQPSGFANRQKQKKKTSAAARRCSVDLCYRVEKCSRHTAAQSSSYRRVAEIDRTPHSKPPRGREAGVSRHSGLRAARSGMLVSTAAFHPNHGVYKGFTAEICCVWWGELKRMHSRGKRDEWKWCLWFFFFF